jgi:hypothetical protein
MSISTSACFEFAASKPRRSSRKSNSHGFLGSAAVAGLVLACGWTVYANILAANVYPALGSAPYDAPVARATTILARTAVRTANSIVAMRSEPAPLNSALLPGPSLSFDDRFGAAARQGVEPKPQIEAPRVAQAAKSKQAPVQVAAIPVPAARPTESRTDNSHGASVRDMAQRAKAAVMSIASADRQTMVEKLWGKAQARPSLLAFASADASVTGSLGPTQNPALGGSAPYDRTTAVYDISARMVYLPDGSKLEAHSGLGSSLDDPRSARIRMRGVTPPHIYELKPREALFHGVPALRLTPIGGDDAIYGRSGLLAHTYMLGPNGDSNGCVSFKDYNAFLNAYHNQGIRRLAVVARVE